MTTVDGGTAFPRADGANACAQEGISLRDWYAGMALHHISTMISVEQVADQAYKIADAMFKARRGEQHEVSSSR